MWQWWTPTPLHSRNVTSDGHRNVMCGLTYCMVQSSSWAANWFAASQEIPRISRNPKVHYSTHKRPSPVSILGQPYSLHITTHPTSCRSILILSTHLLLGLPSGLLPSSFPTKPLHTRLSSPKRATCPACYEWYNDWVTRTIEVMQLQGNYHSYF